MSIAVAYLALCMWHKWFQDVVSQNEYDRELPMDGLIIEDKMREGGRRHSVVDALQADD